MGTKVNNNKLTKLLRHLKEGTVIDRLILIPAIRKEKKFIAFEKSNKPSIIKKIAGIKFILYKDSSLSRLIFNDKFENTEIRFIKKFLKKGDVFVDVGANIGLFSLLASKKVSTSGKIISFEPTPLTFERLMENVRINNASNIQTYQIALSDKCELLTFYCYNDGRDAWNTLAPPESENYSTITVKSTSLDEFVIEHNELLKNTALMKIDAEGWEIPIIKGGMKFLGTANAPSLLVEFSDLQASRANFKCSYLYLLLESLNYRMFRYDPEHNVLIKQANKDYYVYENLIAIKDESTCPIKCLHV